MTISPAIPNTDAAFQAFLDELHQQYAPLSEGTVASYIPELTKVDPATFGICVVTRDGRVFEAGDTRHIFTIQSISKVFVYGMALQEHGRDYVLTRVGVEPTGDAFNAIVLDDRSMRPYNPMVNAGAIATTSLIKGDGPTERLNRMLDMFRGYIGHDIFVDMSVFMSERTTGHRNRGMAHLMRNFGMIDERIDESLDLYFQQCSVTVDCRDLAVMAATLGNHGKNPITGAQAVNQRYIRDILSVMHTCGMYDSAGEWVYRVGLPAKSGVSGGLIVVVPNQFGLAVFSPLLNAQGHSIRGLRVCEALSDHYGLHLFDSSMGCTRFVQQLGQSNGEVS